ncbi:PREDICTED: diphthine--ammonia ligase-like [Amphimedon queenslandica]|uniref:Diphthine--ammonia ligase n=1 Tax=Amphimedon queenslandica TaxID=400682 RepID=A0A1X7TY08_AMPQE|nr:PREDICTED: diphthine--ammonia ligase-like [Amphimedon queenslandica]|eukprot:XP_003389495.1 PREDICTED: diphthine--ammonia ligase-like [Amphimedon queenslandica]
MKVVGLISGGKDSMYNLMQCVASGHSIVALAHLKPLSEEEQDSMMYQSVGSEGVELQAKALGIPLYTSLTRGRTKQTSMEYEREEGDEVEDLMELLTKIKSEVRIEGVSVGAIMSDYQRIRVEDVCKRLQLVPLAYLWHRDQSVLLQDMINDKLTAVLIKVASIGLSQKDLGKTLQEMQPRLQSLNKEYGMNVCGEGGEYETFTLDCPLFQKSIKLVDSKVILHSDDAFAPVAYLKLTQLSLQDKNS